MTFAKPQRNFNFPYLLMFIHLILIIHPMISIGQSRTYQLSQKTDSIVQLLSQDLPVQELVIILKSLENEKSEAKIGKFQAQLDKVEGDERLEMELNERLGRESKWAGKVAEAYQYYTRTLYLAEKLKDNKTIAIACFEIANNIRLGNLNDRPYEPYFKRAIPIFETFNDPLSKSHLLYSKIILEPDNQISLEYANKAIELLKSDLVRSDTLMMESLSRHLNVAGLYEKEGKTIKTFEEGLAVANEIDNNLLKAYILNNMGFEFLLKEEYDKAIPYHLEALDISMLAGIKSLASNSLNNLAVCYRKKGMNKEALDYYHCFFYIQSDINTDKYFQDLAEVQVMHEVDRVELKNDLLLAEQKLQGKQRLILIIISFLLLLIVGFIFWSRRKITKTNTKLQALDKVKSRFFANISHELRTPITLINGPIEAAINGDYGKTSDALAGQLAVVRNNGRNLLNLVNEILDLTKLEAGKLQLVENPSHLYSLLNDLLAAFQSQIYNRKINFQFEYGIEKDTAIMIDEAKFAKIINNLLSNAFKFTEDNGAISLTVKKVNEKLSISVKDSGHGIHLDDIGNVFERFYQSEQPDAKIQGGTGIGLALSQELAKLHGGSISVTSEVGMGSEFIFSFPFKEAKSITIERAEEEFNVGIIKTNLDTTIAKYADIFEIEKPRLLLTEDHKEMREFIASILRPFFKVLEATNGLEALALLNDNNIDMIVSDVMMPKMDGFELLKKIKADVRLRNISMIMLTARAAEEDKLFALTLGVDDYLTKPFGQEELLVRARNILENRIVRKLVQKESASDLNNVDDVDETFIKSLKALIEKNIDNSLLSVSFLALEMSLSERQLLRKIKVLTGFAPVQLIKEVRLLKAKSLLENRQVDSVAEAAYRVGFDKVQYFSSQYINRFGKKPSDSFSTSRN
jgi:signal transduction histidine kinase/DNA-binding response OmpR family regulator